MVAAIPIAIAAAAAVTSAEGSAAQGLAAQNASSANARNERIFANQDELTAKADAAQTEQQTSRIVGQSQANAGASGVQGGTGSPLAVMHDVASQGELSRRLKLFQGQLGAHGAEDAAAIQQAQGNAAATAGGITAGSTILSSVAQQYGPAALQFNWPS